MESKHSRKDLWWEYAKMTDFYEQICKKFPRENYIKTTKNALKSDVINVFYSTDDNLIYLLLVSMISVAVNTSKNVNFIIMHSKLSQDSINKLNTIKKVAKNSTIEFCYIDEKQFSRFKTYHTLTTPAWFRILIPEIYSDIEKVIHEAKLLREKLRAAQD